MPRGYARLCGVFAGLGDLRLITTLERKSKPKKTDPVWQRLWHDRNKMTARFVQSMPSTLRSVEKVVDRTMDVVRQVGCADGCEEAIEISLREALINAVVHGNREDPRKRVTICCMCNPKRGLLLIVRDRGSGFNRRKLPNPLSVRNIFSARGRGIFLIRRFMDEVKFGRGGREIRMRKRPRTTS